LKLDKRDAEVLVFDDCSEEVGRVRIEGVEGESSISQGAVTTFSSSGRSSPSITVDR
jgi:hypothetical protein